MILMIQSVHVHRLYLASQTGKWWENITRLSAQHRCGLSTVSPWSSTWTKVFGPKKMCSLRPNIKMVDEAFNKFVVFPQPIGIWHRQGHLLRESFTIVSDTILSICEHSIQQRGLDQLCSSWLPLFNWVDLDQIFTFKHNWAQRVVTFLWSFWLVLEIFATYHAHCAMHDLSYSWNMFIVVQYNVYVCNKPSWDLIFWENLPSENVYNLMFVLFKYFNMLTTLLVLYPPADVVVKFLSIVFFWTCARSCSTQSRTQVTGVPCKVNGLSCDLLLQWSKDKRPIWM